MGMDLIRYSIPYWDNPKTGLMEESFSFLERPFYMPGSLGTPRYNKLIELLAQARNNAGLTQQAVADQLGKPQSFVAKYERGERRLDFIELIGIAAILEVNITDLTAKISNK